MGHLVNRPCQYISVLKQRSNRSKQRSPADQTQRVTQKGDQEQIIHTTSAKKNGGAEAPVKNT